MEQRTPERREYVPWSLTTTGSVPLLAELSRLLKMNLAARRLVSLSPPQILMFRMKKSPVGPEPVSPWLFKACEIAPIVRLTVPGSTKTTRSMNLPWLVMAGGSPTRDPNVGCGLSWRSIALKCALVR